MYCKKCGRKMGDEDRFCGYCGTMAVGENEEKKPTVDLNWKTEESEKTAETEGPTREELSFNWNLDGFPSGEQKRTDTVDFDWNSVIDEKDRERYNSFFSKDEDKVEIRTDILQKELDETIAKLEPHNREEIPAGVAGESLVDLILGHHREDEDSYKDATTEEESDEADKENFQSDLPEFPDLMDESPQYEASTSQNDDEICEEEGREFINGVDFETTENETDEKVEKVSEIAVATEIETPEVSMEEYEVDIEVPELKVGETEEPELVTEVEADSLEVSVEQPEEKAEGQDVQQEEEVVDIEVSEPEMGEPEEKEETTDTETEIEIPEIPMEEYEVDMEVPELTMGEPEEQEEPSEAEADSVEADSIKISVEQPEENIEGCDTQKEEEGVDIEVSEPEIAEPEEKEETTDTETEIEIPEVSMEEYEVDMEVPELKVGYLEEQNEVIEEEKLSEVPEEESEVHTEVQEPQEEQQICFEVPDLNMGEPVEQETAIEAETDLSEELVEQPESGKEEHELSGQLPEEIINITDISDLEPESMLKDYITPIVKDENEGKETSAIEDVSIDNVALEQEKIELPTVDEQVEQRALTEEEKRNQRLERATLYYKMELLKKLLELENGDVSEEELLSHYDQD